MLSTTWKGGDARVVGNIEKRGDNSYRLRVSGGYTGEGKRITYKKTIQAKNKTEAQKELALFIAEIETGQALSAKKMRFRDYSDFWINNYAIPNLSPKTYERYKSMLKARILPYLGNMYLDKIQPMQLMYLYQELSESTYVRKNVSHKLSSKTVLEHHRLLHSMLQQAVYWQMIPYNPASRVRPPKAKKPNINFYDDAQTIALIKALEGEELKFRVIILLTIFTGLRRGEVLGLEWQDINFKNSSLTVRQASQYVSSIGIYTKDPKTETSNRIISIPESIIKLLKEYQKEQLKTRLRLGKEWIETNRLFVQWNGAPMHPDTITKWFRQFLEDKNLPHITFHGLRHTHATLLISQGLDVRTVSNRLGHAQTSTTLNIYAHAFAKMDREASDKLDNLLYREDTKQYFQAN